MDRPQIYDQADVRSYDHLWAWRQGMYGLSALAADILGQTGTVVAGLNATASSPTSLVINIAAGDIYQLAQVDLLPFGSLTADSRVILQQGFYAAGTLTLSTAGLSSGQSRWALIQATYIQTDTIPGDDPNGGLLPFVNASNPSGPPWSGPGNAGTLLNTRRKGVCVLSVVYGTVASTGTEVPPAASAANVGLYLIDLAFGQTTVAQNQIIFAAPSVGTGVPTNYPFAPFLAGLLSSHHGGAAGQAPKIKLDSEVQGLLPATMISGVRTILTGGLTMFVSPTGNDTNSGLSSGAAFLTLQRAWDVLATNYDLAGHAVTINVANGTYTAGVTASGALVGATGFAVAFVGNTGSPSSVIVTTTGSSTFTAQTGASFSISGMQISAPSAGTQAITASTAGSITFGIVIFGACGTAHIASAAEGFIQCTSGYSIAGNAPVHVSAGSGGSVTVTNVTLTLTGTPAFTTFASVNKGGILTLASLLFTGGATGSRYNAASNGVIDTGGAATTYLPGNAVGTTTTGGLYI